MKILIKNGTIIIDGKKRIENGAVLIENNTIIGIFKDYENIAYDQVIDANENYIVPGLIETHTHGILGFDFNTCQPSDLDKMSDALLDEGVTCFMASLTSEPYEVMLELLSRYHNCIVPNLLGVHIEGPFLNQNNTGVMKSEALYLPQIQMFDDFLHKCNTVKAMTIAPELPHALDLITYGHNKGIVMNIGHSSATAAEVVNAQEHGAKGITHLYNAMSQHLHREPGVVTGAMISNLFCELIVDGFHIHPDVIKATYNSIGKERIILICDANPCKGLTDGIYQFSGNIIEIKDGKARVKDTGRIAGSTITLNKACYNMMKYCHCSIDDAILMASTNPAKLYHLNKGHIEIGYDGDILVINKDFDILAVVNQNKVKKNIL